jgi:DNA replication protein DnaC
MSTVEMMRGECTGCTAPVEREKATGRFAGMFNDLPFICPACDDAKAAEWAAEDAAAERKDADAEHERRVKASDLPPAFLKIDLDRLDQNGCADAIASARYWALRGGGLLFTGRFGVGKSTVAAGALRLLLESKPGRWTSAPLLMAHLGSGFDSPQRARAMQTLQRTSALVLDDLDKTRPTEYGAEQIFLAIDQAVTSERPLLVTTNLGLAQLAQKWPEPFGEAIASRLAGYCKVVEVTGRDRRLG